LQRETIESGEASAGATTPSLARRRVLVVDDNQDSARTLATMLQLLGSEVSVAHDGLQAIEEVRRFRPDMVLMDVGMPRMNGYDATRQLKAMAEGQSPVVVALTGWGQDTDREKSKAAGCDAHLVKPVSLAALQRLFAEVR
jgi:CheY-like chemotaxis protein